MIQSLFAPHFLGNTQYLYLRVNTSKQADLGPLPNLVNHYPTFPMINFPYNTTWQNIDSEESKQISQPISLTEEEEQKITEELLQQERSVVVDCLEISGITGKKKIVNEIKEDIYGILANVEQGKMKPLPVLTVKGKILTQESKEINIILDSGCNQNLIREDLVMGRILKPVTRLKLIAANNQPVRILGEINLTIQIGGLNITDKFLVTPFLTNDAIVGNLFLFKNHMQLDYKNNQIIINKEEVAQVIPMQEGWRELITNYKTNTLIQADTITDIKLNEELIIGPHQHRIIMEIPDDGKELLFETDKNFRKTKKCHAYIQDDITTDPANRKKQISVYNASSTTKRIRAGTLVGITVKPDDDQDMQGLRRTEAGRKKVNKNNGKEELTDKDGVIFDISDHLTIQQHNDLINLLKQFKHMFTTKTQDLKPIKIKPIKLELKEGAKPTNCVPYKQGNEERKILNKMLSELREAHVLESCPHMTENSSPVFLTKNKDNSYRIISDLRRVNSIIKTDVTPIPNINLILSSLNKANTFTRIDLKSAYNQIPIAEESRYLLTIKSQDHMLRYKTMPFGLACASSIFTKIIQSILQPLLYNQCLNYIDDVICYSKDFQGDLESIKQVLTLLDRFGFKLNTKKCRFMYPSTNLLGHRVSREGIEPMAETVAAVKSYKIPTTIKQLRGWLGISGYFRKFIKDYARIMYPITELIKEYNKEGKFTWTSECTEAFNRIKHLLISAPLLRHWDETQDNIIIVDASLIGLGGCLAQEDPQTGKVHPIFYVSKRFTNTQSNYNSVERKMLALAFCVNYFREYTLGKKTKIITDCQSLIHFRHFKNTTARLNKLALSLVDYDLEIIHKKGSQISLADSLSRNPLTEFIDETIFEPCTSIETNNLPTINMEQLQEEDDFLRKIKHALVSPEKAEGRIRRRSRNYIQKDGILYYKHFDGKTTNHLIAIPRSQVDKILKLFHESPSIGAHLSAYKTLQKLRTRYHFVDMVKLTERFCKTCESCQLRKPKTHKNYGLLQPKLPTITPGQHLTLDFIGPLHQSQGYHYILVVTDQATRYCFTKLCRKADAKTVASKLLEICYTVSFPLVVTHDRGTHFHNEVMAEFTTALGIDQRPGLAYMPQCQGITEKNNHTIITCISHYVTEFPNKWAQYLMPITFAYNTSCHASTHEMPFYLLYGFKPTFPSEYMFITDQMDQDTKERLEILKQVRSEIPKILEKAQKTQKHYFDKNKQHIELLPGDEVLIEKRIDKTIPYHKWAAKYEGPYTILRKLNEVTYEILRYHRGKLIPDAVHVSRLKLFYKRSPISLETQV